MKSRHDPQASDATNQIEQLCKIAQAKHLDELPGPLGAILGINRLRSGRLALLRPGPDAFEVLASVYFDAAGAHLRDEEPERFTRGDPMTEKIFGRAEATLWRPYSDGRSPLSPRALELWGAKSGDGLSVVMRIGEGWRLSLCVTARYEEPAEIFERRFDPLKKTLRLTVAAASFPARSTIAAQARPLLSSSQRALLELLASGARPADIAALRGVTESTARNQILGLRRKLGARSNAHAVAICIRRGLIPE